MNSESKATPGPWKLIWYGREVYPYPLSIHTEDDSMWIARDGLVSTPANARLIAAAPEILEALKGLLERYRIMGCGDGPEALAAKLAIARAEGKAS